MKTFLFILGFFVSTFAFAQTKIYDEKADAKADIEKLIQQAQEEHKNIILQVGGNWCSWCLQFNKFITKDGEIAQLVDDNFLYYHLNFSKENKNQDILNRYNNPEELGFPVLVVLDWNGKLLGHQETGDLEMGKSYDRDKVIAMFENWKDAVFMQ